MGPVTIIESTLDFLSLVDELANHRYIAIDTESNSFYAYFEKLCLVQISTSDGDYVIDPLAVEDLSPLSRVLVDPGIEKIFHAASNDIMGLKRDFHFDVSNLFDTSVACKLLGDTQLGLANVLNDRFGVVLNKKWQRFDWGRRPLNADQIDYARLDTHYLIPLRHKLAADLRARQLWEAAREACTKLEAQESQKRPFHPDSFIHIHGARRLDPTGKRILKALFLFREHEARRRNRAPFRILTNETLLRLALDRPKNASEFQHIKGLPRNFQNGHAASSLIALIRKSENPGEECPAEQ